MWINEINVNKLFQNCLTTVSWQVWEVVFFNIYICATLNSWWHKAGLCASPDILSPSTLICSFPTNLIKTVETKKRNGEAAIDSLLLFFFPPQWVVFFFYGSWYIAIAALPPPTGLSVNWLSLSCWGQVDLSKCDREISPELNISP